MGMLISVMMGSATLFLMMLARRKKYEVPLMKMIVLHIVVTLITALGANLGSFLGGMSFKGLRLYGFLLVDTLLMVALGKLFRLDVGRLGDLLSVGIIAVCCVVKIPCIVDGCCFGIELFSDEAGNAVRFPSQIVEFSIWALLTVWLLFVERKGNHKNLLWSIAAIWFGIFRFLVDFMRGSLSELRLVILGLPAGRFWSLVVALCGVAFMVYSFRKYWNRKPTPKEMLRALLGMKIEE